MVSRSKLRRGLEWISGKSRVTIQLNGSSTHIDVVLFPEYPRETNRIILDLKLLGEQSVLVQDLTGNGFTSEFQKRGYGKLIFNIGIQAIYACYGILPGDSQASDIVVKGTTSPAADPETEPDRSACRDHRNEFWSKHGFHVQDPTAFSTGIEAKLSELQLRKGITANGTSCEITVDEFWAIGDAPALFQSDIHALMSVEFEQFNLDACPSVDDIYREWNSAVLSSRVVRYTLWLVLSGLTIYLSLYLSEMKIIFFLSVVGMFFSYLIAIFVEKQVWKRLPGLKMHFQLLKRRNLIIEKISKYIENLETKHNGLLWRLQKGLCQYDSFFEGSVYVEMAENSRRQFSFLMTKSGKYEDYIRFMNTARRIALYYGLAEG